MFWVISVYFNIRNTLSKSGTFLLGHPVYDALIQMDEAKNDTSELRIVQKYPGTPWRRTWTNLHAAPVPEMVKSAWFAVFHDTVPTKDRLAAIRLTNTRSCARYGEPDSIHSIQHTVTECTEGRLIWTRTRKKLGMILRMDPRHIPTDWPIRSAFQYCPSQQ